MSTDPITLAREVLSHDLAVACANQAIGSGSSEPEDYRSLAESTERLAMLAPDLARAVIELTAEVDAYREENARFREQVAHVRALVDELDREAAEYLADADPGRAKPAYAHAARIHTILKGQDA